MLPAEPEIRSFWRDVWRMRDDVTPKVVPRILAFGFIATLVTVMRHRAGLLTLEIGPVELVGATLALLLVLRTNGGYDRWWEGRKLWGGLVNQSRNLIIAARAYAPRADPAWRRRLALWTAAFAHVCRRSLRSDRELPDVTRLLGPEVAGRIAQAEHMPTWVAARLAAMVHEAVERGWLSPFGMLQCEEQRALLIDHLGGCERILKSPLPTVYTIKIRRFAAIYLFALPFSLVERVGWATPLLTMLVAYPMLGLDQISMELENPFSRSNLGHLPLETICGTIERDVIALADDGADTGDGLEDSDARG